MARAWLKIMGPEVFDLVGMKARGATMCADTSGKLSQKHEAKKIELIAGLRDVRKRILTLAVSMTAKGKGQIYLGTWSIHELLAHLAGWDETNLQAAKEVLAGQAPGFYDYYDKDWASYNAGLVAEYGKDDFEELLAHVRQTHAKLLAFIEELPANELWMDRGIRARGWKVTIGRLLDAEKGDEEEHFLQLKQFVETGEPT